MSQISGFAETKIASIRFRQKPHMNQLDLIKLQILRAVVAGLQDSRDGKVIGPKELQPIADELEVAYVFVNSVFSSLFDSGHITGCNDRAANDIFLSVLSADLSLHGHDLLSRLEQQIAAAQSDENKRDIGFKP